MKYPSREQMEVRAYYCWEARGRPWGTPETDWFKTEQELPGVEPQGALLRIARKVGALLGSTVAFLNTVLTHRS